MSSPETPSCRRGGGVRSGSSSSVVPPQVGAEPQTGGLCAPGARACLTTQRSCQGHVFLTVNLSSNKRVHMPLARRAANNCLVSLLSSRSSLVCCCMSFQLFYLQIPAWFPAAAYQTPHPPHSSGTSFSNNAWNILNLKSSRFFPSSVTAAYVIPDFFFCYNA